MATSYQVQVIKSLEYVGLICWCKSRVHVSEIMTVTVHGVEDRVPVICACV